MGLFDEEKEEPQAVRTAKVEAKKNSELTKAKDIMKSMFATFEFKTQLNANKKRYYPVNQAAHDICTLIKQKTVTPKDIENLKTLLKTLNIEPKIRAIQAEEEL